MSAIKDQYSSTASSINLEECNHKKPRLFFSFCFVITSFTLLAMYMRYEEGAKRCSYGHHHRKSLNTNGVKFRHANRILPQCIIIGARKCGTRALLEFLNLHPSVKKVTEEVHFFDNDRHYGLGLGWYRRKMPFSFPSQITIEKSPAYFVTPSVPSRIRAMNMSIKLLLIVRDPVTRLISDYTQLAANKAKKNRLIKPFEYLVLSHNGSICTDYKAVQTSIYVNYFRQWLQVFSRQQIHVLDGDRLVLDPFTEVQKIETFLKLPHKINKDNFYYNKTKGFFCAKNETSEKCLNDSKGRRHPGVSPHVVAKLREFYTPYNRQFYMEVGHDFQWPE